MCQEFRYFNPCKWDKCGEEWMGWLRARSTMAAFWTHGLFRDEMRGFELNAKAKTLNIHQIQGRAGKHSDWCWHVDGSSKSALSKRDGNGDVSCPCDYYVCQLWAASEYSLKQDEARSGHVHTLRFDFESGPALFPVSGCLG